MRIAIVTAQFEGLTRNAGIGSAYRRLADLLASRGHAVEVVFMPIDVRVGDGAARQRWERRLAAFKRGGFHVVIPSDKGIQRLSGELGYLLARSQCVYRHLRERHFDAVHSPDNFGLVYVALKTKKAGSAFADTEFIIGTHGPRLWHEGPNGTPTAPAVLMSKLDQDSLELADRVVSPSRYMLRHLKSTGWRVPRKASVIPNVNSLQFFRQQRFRIRTKGQRPIVFFGRLETRKGVWLFCRALGIMLETDPKLGLKHPLEVIFLGSDPEAGEPTIARVKGKLAPFKGRVRPRFQPGLSSSESLRLLRGMRNPLVCMPSLVENSPYTIVECLEAGLDFVATRAGGQAELLFAKDRSKVLCAPDARSLSLALRRRLSQAPECVRPSGAAVRANEAWVNLHEQLAGK